MIDKNNMDQVFFDYFEGNLSGQERSAVDQFVSTNPSYLKDFQAWGNSYVQDDHLQFKNVDSLLAKEESAPASWLKWSTSSLILILLSFFSYAVFLQLAPGSSDKKVFNGHEKIRKNKEKTSVKTTPNNVAAIVESGANSYANNNNNNNNNNNSNNSNKAQQKQQRSKGTTSAGANAMLAKHSSNKSDYSDFTAQAANNEAQSTLQNEATAASQSTFLFSFINAVGKNTIAYDDSFTALQPDVTTNEMNQKGGLELVNLGDPFALYGGVSPIQENPSFAGNTDGIRIKYLARSEWPEVQSAACFTNTISIDTYVKKLKGGVAILYSNDIIGNNQMNANNFTFVYSPKIKVGKWSVEPSVRYNLNNRTINWNQLSAGDSFDPRTGTLFASTAFIPENTESSQIMINTVGAGILFNGKRVYGGVAFDNLFNPSYDDEHFDQKVYIPLKLTAQLGTDIRKNAKSDWVYSPSISYRKQGLYNKLWMSNIVKYKHVIAGASFSTADAMLFSLGYSSDNLRITYSYGLSTIPFNYSSSNQLYASHQLTMRYVIKRAK